MVIPGSIMKGMEVDLGSQWSLPQLDMSETLVSTIQRGSRSRGCVAILGEGGLLHVSDGKTYEGGQSRIK